MQLKQTVKFVMGLYYTQMKLNLASTKSVLNDKRKEFTQ